MAKVWRASSTRPSSAAAAACSASVEGQLVGPRGLGLGMLLIRLRALDGRLGLGLGLRTSSMYSSGKTTASRGASAFGSSPLA